MPIKFKPDSKERSQTGRSTSEARTVTKCYYLHATPTADIQKALETCSPKLGQKFRNELVRRNVL